MAEGPGPYYSVEDVAIGQIQAAYRKQRERWSYEHDRNHEPWEWLGLIAQYAAAGRYADAAALCISAAIAESTNRNRQEATDG